MNIMLRISAQAINSIVYVESDIHTVVSSLGVY